MIPNIKFDPSQYRTFAEIMGTEEEPADIEQVVDGMLGPFYEVQPGGLAVPSGPESSKLESKIKIGRSNKGEEVGEMIQLGGYLVFLGTIDGNKALHYVLVTDPKNPNSYLDCRLEVRDGSRSEALTNISLFVASMEQGGYTGSTNASPVPLYIPVHPAPQFGTVPSGREPVQVTVFGTMQRDSSNIYLDIDAIKHGNNITSHNYRGGLGFLQ